MYSKVRDNRTSGGDERPRTNNELMNALEGMRIVSMREASMLTGLSADTLRRHHGHLILRLSAKRCGLRLRDVLTIGDPQQA